jgi:hypothetical protein
MFGKDVQITDGDVVIGTKALGDYSREVSDATLARDANLDIDSCECFILFKVKISRTIIFLME